MILDLLAEIRPLSNHKVLYDSYTHAAHVMSILSTQTNAKPLIVCGLLHEVKAKLGSYKLKKCLDLVKKEIKSKQDIQQIEYILQLFSKSQEQSKETFATNILTQCDSSVELLFLADMLSEVELTHSTVALKGLQELIDKLIGKELIDEKDNFVIKIKSAINYKLIHHKHGDQTEQLRKT